MNIYSLVLTVQAKEQFEFRDITNDIQNVIQASKISNGFVLVRSRHTTAAITTTEPDQDIHVDCQALIDEMTPITRNYRHSYEGNVNGRAHQAEMLFFGNSTWAAIRNNNLDLGRWQRIYLVELFRPMKRDIDLIVVGE